ncbi:MAG: L-threonylcarbamoyladenylate synthase [Thermoguttaceae bacterium]
MPPVVIDLQSADDERDVVHRAVQTLVEGGLVALPTETVYGLAASALDEEAVARLIAAKGRDEGKPLALAIKSADEARDYVPDICPLARRLARRCWPGPITLVLDNSHPDSLVRRLPPKVRQVVAPQQSVGLRVPGHRVVLEVLRMLAGPLVLTSANQAGRRESVTAAEVLDSVGSKLGLVVDDGRCRFAQPSSVVRVANRQFEVLRAGVVPEKTLRRLSSLMLLFVCTGNTCRSPMAEMICRRLLADRMKCGMDHLEEHGVLVSSAGTSAILGGRAAAEAVQCMDDFGIELGDHETQPLTEPLVRHSDVIYVMARSHRQAILSQWPSAADRTVLLSPDGMDIADPIGGSLECYRQCAEQIEAALAARINQLEI